MVVLAREMAVHREALRVEYEFDVGVAEACESTNGLRIIGQDRGRRGNNADTHGLADSSIRPTRAVIAAGAVANP
jgi:hypothetical protein